MAVIETTRNTNFFNNAFASTFAALAAWNDARATRKALSALTDRELDDIGLTRADINSITARA